METAVAAIVPEYPKIETLYDRDPKTFKVVPGIVRCPEFDSVKWWHVTEKIDGTNVRIALLPDDSIFFGGRTDAAQMPPKLLQRLREMFTIEKMRAVFRPEGKSPLVVLYGEGYGASIQKAGGNYRGDVSVRLFDIWIDGVWIAQEKVAEMAEALSVGIAPVLGVMTTEEAIAAVRAPSELASKEGGVHNFQHEGVIARSHPLMLDRMGNRIIWKLKAKDFPQP